MENMTKGKAIGVMVVGGIALLFSFLMPYAAISEILAYQEMKDWVQTPATIKSLEYFVPEYDPDESTSLKVRYAYQVLGKTYTHSRLSPQLLSGDLLDEIYSELEPFFESGQNIVVYVDPENPRKAVLFHRLYGSKVSEHLLFSLPFLVFGLIFFALGFSFYKKF